MHNRYKVVLCTVDLDPGSREIFGQALLTASLHHAALHVLHMIPPVDEAVIQTVAAVMGSEALIDTERAHLEEQQHQLRERFLPTDGPSSCREQLAALPQEPTFTLRHGRVVTGILDYAADISAELIVTGAHRRGTLHPAFLGSTAKRLLGRKQTIPVLVVPPK